MRRPCSCAAGRRPMRCGPGRPPPPGRLGGGRRRHPRHAAAARHAHARGGAAALKHPGGGQDLLADYRSTGLTLTATRWPCCARSSPPSRCRPAAVLRTATPRPAGARQRPGHAPPAPRDGQGRGLRHAGRRHRRRQRDRLAAVAEAQRRRCWPARCSPSTASGSARAR
jgi:hypothetical protein